MKDITKLELTDKERLVLYECAESAGLRTVDLFKLFALDLVRSTNAQSPEAIGCANAWFLVTQKLYLEEALEQANG